MILDRSLCSDRRHPCRPEERQNRYHKNSSLTDSIESGAASERNASGSQNPLAPDRSSADLADAVGLHNRRCRVHVRRASNVDAVGNHATSCVDDVDPLRILHSSVGKSYGCGWWSPLPSSHQPQHTFRWRSQMQLRPACRRSGQENQRCGWSTNPSSTWRRSSQGRALAVGRHQAVLGGVSCIDAGALRRGLRGAQRGILRLAGIKRRRLRGGLAGSNVQKAVFADDLLGSSIQRVGVSRRLAGSSIQRVGVSRGLAGRSIQRSVCRLGVALREALVGSAVMRGGPGCRWSWRCPQTCRQWCCCRSKRCCRWCRRDCSPCSRWKTSCRFRW